MKYRTSAKHSRAYCERRIFAIRSAHLISTQQGSITHPQNKKNRTGVCSHPVSVSLHSRYLRVHHITIPSVRCFRCLFECCVGSEDFFASESRDQGYLPHLFVPCLCVCCCDGPIIDSHRMKTQCEFKDCGKNFGNSCKPLFCRHFRHRLFPRLERGLPS